MLQAAREWLMSSKTKGSEEAGIKLDEDEKEVVERESALPVQIVYEIVGREGEEELKRPNQSLALSGLTAGLAIGFSALCEAMLLAHLPDEPWRPLADNFGYSVGFVLVILARLQLFTENTITVILPVLLKPSRAEHL